MSFKSISVSAKSLYLWLWCGGGGCFRGLLYPGQEYECAAFAAVFQSPGRSFRSDARRSKSFEEREEEYERVRKRIFNRDVSTFTQTDTHLTPSICSLTLPDGAPTGSPFISIINRLQKFSHPLETFK